jgi:hypothetical protein
VYLHVAKARVACCAKQPELEHLAWVEKSAQQTVRLKWAIYGECKHTAVNEIASGVVGEALTVPVDMPVFIIELER